MGAGLEKKLIIFKKRFDTVFKCGIIAIMVQGNRFDDYLAVSKLVDNWSKEPDYCSEVRYDYNPCTTIGQRLADGFTVLNGCNEEN